MSETLELELRNISGPDRAAIFLLSLGEQHANKLLDMMDDEEIRDVSHRMSTLGSVSGEVVKHLFIKFGDEISSTGTLVGTYHAVNRLLSNSLGSERAKNILEEMRGPAGRTVWDKLGNVNEAVLASYLKNEYPQTVAVVLSKIKADNAARVLSKLPEHSAMEVVMRMLRMEPVQKDILDDVERTMRSEFMSNLARAHKGDSFERMAEIFNNLDRSAKARILSALEEHNPEAAERVRALMFTFEDLVKLDPAGVQTLLHKIDKNKLAVALKGASEILRQLIFSNMSERAGKILREDMQALGPVRLREVDLAQKMTVKLAKDLAASGEVTIVEHEDEDELVY